MMHPVTGPSDDTLRLWLLQLLPPAQAALLEERLMHDDALLGRLREAEIDLVDDYSRGELDPVQAHAFRTHRLVDGVQRDNLRAARAWASLREAAADVRVREPAPRETVPMRRLPRATMLGLAAAAGVFVAVALLDWSLHGSMRSDNVATYTLLAATSRGTEASTLRLPPAGVAIRLQVEVAEPTHRYRLFVETQGSRRQIAGELEPRQLRAYAYVEAQADAALLAPGTHRVLLIDDSDGGEPEHVWDVQVEKNR